MKEGNEQLTAGKNELHRCRDGSRFIIQFSQKRNERRVGNCKEFFRVLQMKHN